MKQTDSGQKWGTHERSRGAKSKNIHARLTDSSVLLAEGGTGGQEGGGQRGEMGDFCNSANKSEVRKHEENIYDILEVTQIKCKPDK